MSFATPLALLALLIVPLLIGGYVLLLRRKRKRAVRYSSVALIRMAMPKRSRWKRHVPIALFIVAITALVVSTARPRISSSVPVNKTSIILTLDVSGSMCATDVDPNRLTAAQNAAKEFVKNQVSGTKIGIIAFANFAQLIVPPTTDKDTLTKAIDGLTTGRGTVIGAATLTAVDAIAAIDPNVAPVDAAIEATATQGGGRGGGQTTPASAPDLTPAAVPPQGYVPDIVVLLTDGANTRGISPVDAAKQAAARRIRIYTIGFGTDHPTSLVCSASQLGAGGFDGGGPGFPGGRQGGGGGGRNALDSDQDTLKAVSAATGGTFYQAQDAQQLRDVFAKLPSDIRDQREEHEISVWFVVAGALLAAGALGLSLWWNRT